MTDVQARIDRLLPEMVALRHDLHRRPDLAQGQIGLCPGPFLASADGLRIIVTGTDAHAAFPHQGVDTVLVAAHVVVALQSLVSRNTDPLDSAVVTVAQVHGGTADNIIPEQVTPSGTVRILSSDTRRRLRTRLEALAVGTARAFGADAEVVVEEGYPVLENDPEAIDYVRRVTGGAQQVVEIAPVMGGEDFAFYAQRVPAVFFSLGVRPPGCDDYANLHQPDYDFHDGAIAHGVAMHVEIVRRFWREGPGRTA